METKNKSFICLAIALISLALGAAALFVSINSVQKQKASQISLEEKYDKAFAAAIESKKNLDELNSLKKEIALLKDSIKQNYDTSNKNMKSAFEYYSKPISENRELIIANQKAIKQLVENNTPAPVVTPVVEEKKEDATSTSSDDSQYIIYTIKAGDYFSKLAKQFNVSIEAIEEANPNVSSTALQIGQKINIPKAK